MFVGIRRSRAFIALAVITVLAFYHFSGHESWSDSGPEGASSLRLASLRPVSDFTSSREFASWRDEKVNQEEQDPLEDASLQSDTEDAIGVPIAHIPSSTVPILVPSETQNIALKAAIIDAASKTTSIAKQTTDTEESISTSAETTTESKSASPIHWSKQPEHFPVDSIIQVPTGTPKAIPRIQHIFEKESEQDNADRLAKMAAIKQAAEFSWKGYKQRAFMHDEVKPVTGEFADPFCGWGATLVDSLDTLWIMGMREIFDEAVRAVGTIDFTTSPRSDIPLFETVIRYLGGLLGAYDISGHKYPILLDKAVELAEILMGAFDTRNRMPVRFHYWMPAFESQPHRANNRTIMSELGSLSMEFTRLAQITKDSKYYDAIDRVTDAFYEWQNRVENGTLVPGLFSTFVDASGCERPNGLYDSHGEDTDTHENLVEPSLAHPAVTAEYASPGQPSKLGKIGGWNKPFEEGSLDTQSAKEELLGLKVAAVPNAVPAPARPAGNMGKISGWDSASDSEAADTELYNEIHRADDVYKRQLIGELADATEDSKIQPKLSGSNDCIPRGLMSVTKYGSDNFTLGAMADSTYEYFSKQYILLGGLEPKYRTLYEKAMDAAIKHLLFRPMIPDGNILFAGEYTAFLHPDEQGNLGKLKPTTEHLTCFVGAMFAMGAKIFGREADLDYGARLTEGCVWAYSSTETGLMPETSFFLPCDDMNDCRWNETKYWEELDPHSAYRMEKYHVGQQPLQPTTPADTADAMDLAAIAVTDLHDESTESAEHRLDKSSFSKRQDAFPPGSPNDVSIDEQPLNHEEYVRRKIEIEKLPPGFTHIPKDNRQYRLRPEAIESVFYMHRITGDPHWRQVGWQMWLAVSSATRTQFGHSSIGDVMTKDSPKLDTEESFWLAETLKYFYLLFEDEEVLSLDEWVFNTEAHPFKRPDAPAVY